MQDRVRWLYLDMNSFFASVEQQLNPKLRGKPMAVVPMMADTTCVIAASYEAKAFGIKTGTLVGDAKKLCPKIQFVEGGHGNYVRYHNQIVEVVESCVPVEAVCSIDEVACRLTGSQQELARAKALALAIKSKIRREVGDCLKSSVGVAPNRYLAKIAADMQKPDGFTAIRPCDLPAILFPLKLRDLPGVGPRMEKRLRLHGIHTMEKLLSLSEDGMRATWGSVVGVEMMRLLRGEELESKTTIQKSLGHSHVLPPELRNEPGALKVLKKLTAKAALRLRREKFWASSIEIYVRFSGQETWSARCGLIETQDTLAFLHAIDELWKGLPPGAIFAVGMVFGGLVPDSLHSPTLFDDPRRERLTRALDAMNDKFGKDKVHFGAVHESTSIAPLRIAFTRIPDEAEIE